MSSIQVVDYDPAWPDIFEALRRHVWAVVADFALAVEHVGSTSVPGLAAKPVIDMSIVIPSSDDIPLAVERLATLGYVHLGERGIHGREAFQAPAGLPDHHLYVCPAGSLGLRNHLALRDYLCAHPEAAKQYGRLKQQLAVPFKNDIEGYVDGKTDFIVTILHEMGFSPDELDVIAGGNRQQLAANSHEHAAE